MLCRALLAAIAISYLICVLFLSGIQKEDLDVALLRKLQRYNVDFDDLNNQKLRKDCLNNSDSNISKEDNDRSSEQNITIIEDMTITESTSKADYFEKINATEFESVITYLKNMKNRRIGSTTTLNSDTKSSTFKILEVVTESYKKQNIVSEITPNTERSFIEEDVIKFLESYVKHVKSKISINNNTEIQKISTEKTQNNLTKLDVKKSDTTNSKEVERISNAVAAFLTKKVALPVETQTETTKNRLVTDFEPSQANAQEIEKKFASGLAAINKLNENISILQKNMNIGKFQYSENNNQTRESLESKNTPNKGAAEPPNKGLAEGVVIISQDSVQNIVNNLQNDQSQHLPKTQSQEAIKTNRTNNYSYDSQYEFSDHLTKQTINVDTSRNNQPQFSSHAINSLDLLSSDYNNKQNQAGISMQNFEGVVKSGQLQYPPNPQEITSYSYANQNIPNSMIVGTNSNSNILKYNNFASQSHNLQERINHGYEQQRAPESNTMIIPKDEKNNPNLYAPSSHDLFPYNYNRAKEAESNLQNTQYTEVTFKSDQPRQALVDVIQYPYDKRQPENLANNVQNNIDRLQNNQILNSLYPKISQDTINSDHERQIEHDAHVMEVPNIDDKLKNRLQYSIYNQNSQETVSYNYDKQRPDTYASNISNFNQKRIQFSKPDDGKETKKDPFQSISSDMILQIAESVKELVLKDLRKDISSPTSITSSTTLTTFTTTKKSPVTSLSTLTWNTPRTTKPPTIKPVTIVPTTLITSTNTPLTTASKTYDATTPKKFDLNKVQKATQAIEKFIELFEQLKVVQEKTANNKEKRIILPKHIPAKPFQLPIVMIPQALPPTSPYGMGILPKPMPIVVEHFIPPHLTHPPIPQNLIPHTMESMQNIITPIHQQRFEPRNWPQPVMIQTNLNEIQPLGIPVVKPESMNLNIILTTQNPFWTGMERGRWNFMEKYGRNPDNRNAIKSVKESLNSYSNVKVNNYAANNIKPNDNNAANKNTESKLFVNYKGQINDEKTRLNFLNIYNNRYQDSVANQNRLAPQQDNLPSGYITEFERTGNKDTMGHEYKSELNPIANLKNNVTNTFYKDVIDKLPKNNKNEFDNPTKKIEDFISRGISEQSAPSLISNIKNDKSKYIGLNSMINGNHVFQYETAPEQHISNNEEHFNSKLTDLPNGFQNTNNKDDISLIKKVQILDRTNQFNTFGMLPKDASKYYENHDLNPNLSDQQKHLNDAFKTIHEYYENGDWQQKPRLYDQLHNSNMPEIMPTKTIDERFNKPDMHLNNYDNHLNMIQKNEGKYEPKLNPDTKNTNIYKQNYPYDMQQTFNDMYPKTILKDKFKDLEKYLDNSRQIQPITIRESLDNFKDTPNFKNLINNVKIPRPTNENKVANKNIDPYYSYPNNFENRLTEHSSPYQELDISSRYKTRSESLQRQDVRSWYKNRKDTNNQDHHHIEIITAMIGGRPKPNKEIQDFESVKNSHGNHEYRPQVESLYTRPHNRRPQMESSDGEMRLNQKTTYGTSDSDKQYPNMGVRGFHEKLEGSDSWPDTTSDCGPDERCSEKILSRQQLPLSSSKKKKYDDSHFKNFLQTQQKVNQMLERILATKSDGVRSVEAV